MKSDRLVMSVLSGLLVIAVVVGLVLAFKPPPEEAGAGKGEEGKGGGLLAGLRPRKEGIAVVEIYGSIQTESSRNFFGFTYGGADAIVKKIKRLRKNEMVKAIVVRVNSPGGTVAASQEILSEIKEAARDGKKVVVSMADMAASGGYYVSCGADRIFADQGTITGSIGVFVGNLNITGLAEKIGVDMNIIKSGKHKDILSPWREMTGEERELLRETVSEVYEQFLDEVSEGRGIPKKELRPIADGRIFTGERAKELGLVDELGGLQDAIEEAQKLAGLKGEPVIIKDYQGWWEDMFAAMEQKTGKETDLLELLGAGRSTADRVPVTYEYRP